MKLLATEIVFMRIPNLIIEVLLCLTIYCYNYFHSQNMKNQNQLYISNRNDWRQWLKANHDSCREIWLLYFKKHTGKLSIPYDDAVEEALCFGWIDSIVKRIDDKRYMQKFTPRKDSSVWSALNKKRVKKMIAAGKMTEHGLVKIESAKRNGKWNVPPSSPLSTKIATEFEDALIKNLTAKKNFDLLAPSYKRHYIGWINSAKREDTKMKRIYEAVQLLEQNKKLGLK